MIEKAPSSKSFAILNSARKLMMQRGYNGFSFRDVAAEVGIKSASIHHHYATKADLVEATTQAYRKNFTNALNNISGENTPQILRAYGKLFIASLQERGVLCLGGMLAAESKALPDKVQTEVCMFFNDQYQWITAVLREGKKRGDIREELDENTFAKTFVSSLEGAMMVARAIDQPDDLEAALEQLIELVRS